VTDAQEAWSDDSELRPFKDGEKPSKEPPFANNSNAMLGSNKPINKGVYPPTMTPRNATAKRTEGRGLL
jgi:hypothetical protein